MFETLDDAFEKSKRPLDRGVPILVYSVSVVFSSIALIVGVVDNEPQIVSSNYPPRFLGSLQNSVVFAPAGREP
jgi:hypothetical protein